VISTFRSHILSDVYKVYVVLR